MTASPLARTDDATPSDRSVRSADPSAVPGSKGYIAAQASQNYAQLLTGWGHEATWIHFDNETHSSLVFNFGTTGDAPTDAVGAFLDGLTPP